MSNWQKKVIDYCRGFNIPLEYLSEVLIEPKVVPMIRGKAFEFSAMIALQKLLPKKDWKVEKIMMNAQLGYHDIDVKITHRKSKKAISVECKLAKKEGYRQFADGHSEIRVKCMRSRTLGPSKVEELAPKLKIKPKVLAIHNDQYLPSDFDLVITSIGNAFYRTNKETNQFEWKPTQQEIQFLKKLFGSKYPISKLKDKAFNKMFVAKAKDLVAGQYNARCSRKKCQNKKSCGFVPNYPIIYFEPKTNIPINGWFQLEKSLPIFKSFVS